MSESSEDAAPGWDAIDAAFDALYPGEEPVHWGVKHPYMFGGPDPITGISAWKRLAPVQHWHFVTYGFSELYEKESEDAGQSGYGFELTFRLACDPAEETPPVWVFGLLQNLARYVFKSGNVFADGHWMSANGPIALETDTRIVSLAFVADPEVPAVDTENGHVVFLQLVGLTIEEEDAVKRWNVRELLDALLPHMPLWVTDLARDSLLDLPDVATRITEGSQGGSSTGLIFTDTLDWTTRKRLLRAPIVEITLGANQIDDLVATLPLRLPFGNPLGIFSQAHGRTLHIEPADRDSVREEDRVLYLGLTEATAEALAAALRPLAESYPTPGFDAVVWKVQQSHIRDRDGTVLRTIG